MTFNTLSYRYFTKISSVPRGVKICIKIEKKNIESIPYGVGIVVSGLASDTPVPINSDDLSHVTVTSRIWYETKKPQLPTEKRKEIYI